jgi:hypothetical protein
VLTMASTLMISASLYAVGGDVFWGKITTDPASATQEYVLVTFNKDGTMVVTDSVQQGGPTFAPFSLQQGNWKQCGDTIVYKTMDVTYQKYVTCDGASFCCEDQQFVVVTATLHKNRRGQFEGPVQVNFYPINVADVNNPSPLLRSINEHIVLDRIHKPEDCSSSSSSCS